MKITQNSDRVLDPKKKILYGFFLWGFISFAYLLFVANWGFAVGLAGGGKGDPGFLGYFGIEKTPSFDLISNAANWGITIGRGIGSVIVAILLVRFAHKNATTIALVLTLLGIPAQYLPGQPWGYALFLILRTFMAIGGTMLIILTQPIAANFFQKKQKAIVSQFGIWFYPLGTIIAVLPFVVTGNTASIREHWQTIFTTISALNIIPLIIFIFFGSKFDKVPKNTESNEPKTRSWTILKGYLKQKSTWVWVLLYGGWLCAVVFPTSLSHFIFNSLSGVDRKSEEFTYFTKLIRYWYIAFLAAVFVGPISIGLWSKYNLKRKTYVASVIMIGIIMYILSLITFIYGVSKNSVVATVFFYIFGFLCGMCLWGIQGVILNLPHEYKDNNPKTIGWMFSLIWGLGYIAFTIVLIIISLVSLIGKEIGVGSDFSYRIIEFVIIIVASLIAIIGTLLLKEPSDDAQSMPNWMRKIFKSKRNSANK
ncbi:hexose phosphate transporter [Mycoplasmopsis opalescens]|uniref:hexose phosphate transporter n=1 Tax=Mycoplasmopsis opalescens TaxID=114886 RepID=UPI00069118BF|nr:hexose phosphate transporter [Mycoplasmopsis opalescens]